MHLHWTAASGRRGLPAPASDSVLPIACNCPCSPAAATSPMSCAAPSTVQSPSRLRLARRPAVPHRRSPDAPYGWTLTEGAVPGFRWRCSAVRVRGDRGGAEPGPVGRLRAACGLLPRGTQVHPSRPPQSHWKRTPRAQIERPRPQSTQSSRASVLPGGPSPPARPRSGGWANSIPPAVAAEPVPLPPTLFRRTASASTATSQPAGPVHSASRIGPHCHRHLRQPGGAVPHGARSSGPPCA